jgi:predicted MFS family arabinose efflux permease
MSAFMAGVMLGAISLGSMSDAFGRKITLFTTLVWMIGTTAIESYVSSFSVYCISRAVNGFFCGGHILALSVLCNELIGSENRGAASAVMSTAWSMGTDRLAYIIVII